jgi:hypothetical protein
VRLLRMGRRFEVPLRFVAVRRFAVVRPFAIVRRLVVVRRFAVVRRFEVVRRFSGLYFFRAVRFLRFAIRCLLSGASTLSKKISSQRWSTGRVYVRIGTKSPNNKHRRALAFWKRRSEVLVAAHASHGAKCLPRGGTSPCRAGGCSVVLSCKALIVYATDVRGRRCDVPCAVCTSLRRR